MKYNHEDYVNPRQMGGWDRTERGMNPRYGSNLYQLMKDSKIFPENMEGFVFLSVSANKGTKERQLAFSLDLDKNVQGKNFNENKKPLIIAADMSLSNLVNLDGSKGDIATTIFDHSPSPELSNINFNYILFDANKIPYSDESVDIVFDRLGAIWYTTRYEEDIKKTIDLLNEYKRVLKKTGKVIVDAHPVELSASLNVSTYHSLMNYFGVINLKDLNTHLRKIGLAGTLVGGERSKNRILVLEKLDQEIDSHASATEK